MTTTKAPQLPSRSARNERADEDGNRTTLITRCMELGIGTTAFPPDPNISAILLTGGLGFIPSWFLRHLVFTYRSYRVVCIDNRGYCASLHNIAACRSQPNFVFEECDITDKAKVLEIMRRHRIDAVVHMAAESHVDHSFGNPDRFTNTNVIGTQNLLEVTKTINSESDGTLVSHRVHRFIHMSTDEVYGEVGGSDKDLLESAILAPTNPYAASKAAGDMFVGAYLKSFNVPAIIVRCNNIYGPMQFPEKIIPKFIRLLQRGEKCTLHGDGSNSRRYLFIVDAVNALDTILHKGAVGKIYNAGSDNELANLEITKMLLRRFGKRDDDDGMKENVVLTKDRPFNDHRYAINSTRLHALGWEPLVGFETGIRLTIDWYNQHSDDWWEKH